MLLGLEKRRFIDPLNALIILNNKAALERVLDIINCIEIIIICVTGHTEKVRCQLTQKHINSQLAGKRLNRDETV